MTSPAQPYKSWYIEWTLEHLSMNSITEKHWDYFKTVEEFFRGVKNPLDLDYLTSRPNPNTDRRLVLEATAHFVRTKR